MTNAFYRAENVAIFILKVLQVELRSTIESWHFRKRLQSALEVSAEFKLWHEVSSLHLIWIFDEEDSQASHNFPETSTYQEIIQSTFSVDFPANSARMFTQCLRRFYKSSATFYKASYRAQLKINFSPTPASIIGHHLIQCCATKLICKQHETIKLW